MESKAGNNSINFDININELKRVIIKSLIVIVFLLTIASVLVVWINLNFGSFFLIVPYFFALCFFWSSLF
jgi:hypothetical protein